MHYLINFCNQQYFKIISVKYTKDNFKSEKGSRKFNIFYPKSAPTHQKK